MKHMHVSEECGWTCWIGCVLLVVFFKNADVGARHLRDGLSPLLRTLFTASDASGAWHVGVAWLTNLTLYFYCMTEIRSSRHFCTLWAKLVFCFVLLPLFIKKLLFSAFLSSSLTLLYFLWDFIHNCVSSPTLTIVVYVMIPRLQHVGSRLVELLWSSFYALLVRNELDVVWYF